MNALSFHTYDCRPSECVQILIAWRQVKVLRLPGKIPKSQVDPQIPRFWEKFQGVENEHNSTTGCRRNSIGLPYVQLHGLSQDYKWLQWQGQTWQGQGQGLEDFIPTTLLPVNGVDAARSKRRSTNVRVQRCVSRTNRLTWTLNSSLTLALRRVYYRNVPAVLSRASLDYSVEDVLYFYF